MSAEGLLIVEDYRRLLCSFTAAMAPEFVPAGMSSTADDPMRLVPLSSTNACVERLLDIRSDVPVEWLFGEHLAANSVELLTACALSSANIGEALEVARRNQDALTNARTISHRPLANGGLVVAHHSAFSHLSEARLLFNAFAAAKLIHIFSFYSGSERQHQLDVRAGSFGELMRRIDRELDFIGIEFRDGEVIFTLRPEVVNHKLPDTQARLRRVLKLELRRKLSDRPPAEKWKDRIRYHLRTGDLSTVSLDDVCGAFRVERRTLGRLLRDEGTTFSAILTEVRRDKAFHLLQNTSKPLKRVAAELGFNSDASFNMAFKSWTGTTPMKFRKLQTVHHEATGVPAPSE